MRAAALRKWIIAGVALLLPGACGATLLGVGPVPCAGERLRRAAEPGTGPMSAPRSLEALVRGLQAPPRYSAVEERLEALGFRCRLMESLPVSGAAPRAREVDRVLSRHPHFGSCEAAEPLTCSYGRSYSPHLPPQPTRRLTLGFTLRPGTDALERWSAGVIGPTYP